MSGFGSRSIGLLAGMMCLALESRAQLTTGRLEGRVENWQGQPRASMVLEIEEPLGPVLPLGVDSQGEFSAVLPYGEYTVRAPMLDAICRARIRPLGITRCTLRPGEHRTADAGALPTFTANNTAELLLLEAPGVSADPLDFAGLGSTRLPLLSGASAGRWTGTMFRLNGLDATDSWQPGLPAMWNDLAAVDTVVVREAYAPGAGPLDTFGEGVFLRSAPNSMHFALGTEYTGSALAGSNLPPAPDRGTVERPDEFRWFTRDSTELDGRFGRRADFSATATGQWASQSAPQRPDDIPIDSRMLLASVRGRARPGSRDLIDALYSGSRVDLDNTGWPAGMEAFLASPLMPSFYGASGFENLREADHFDFIQAGWAHQFDGARVLEVRYGYSIGHLDTSPVSGAQGPAVIDLLSSAPADAPFSSFALRTRHEIDAMYQAWARPGGIANQFAFGGDWEASQPRNRFQSRSGEDTITIAGQPAFDVRLNTPAETRERIDAFTPNAHDLMQLAGGVTLYLSLALDVSRGAVAGQPTAISWTSPSPRAGVAVPVPHFSRLVLRASYARTYSILAGRYLDFADPSALSGQVSSAQTGQLLERFGGAWSAISPDLKRPYADEFHAALHLDLPGRSAFSLDLPRRDDKQRIAAVNTGVPFTEYQPVAIQEPAPFLGQSLTVEAQNPDTLGQDQYLLTNPAGLRELSENLTATASTHLFDTDFRASFSAEKSFGPTNPGSSAWVNDPGLIGALYSNPNTSINATGHPYMDRAFLGKFQTVTKGFWWMGGIQILNAVNYLDGLPFGRELLVTGLPQGPFLVNATIRGSPEGGSRAQHVLNWNLRASRDFEMARGRLTLAADLLNVLNNGDKIVENDLSGPQFNQRTAIAIPSPRTLRLSARWSF
ncbi:MAG TPA: hypothetical protein VKV17_21540 [Bryobacteraceae bacterium]|nr:hypothetical protein [Bryobacteraceae bacterium]